MFIFEVLYISALKVFHIVLQSVPTLTRASAPPPPKHTMQRLAVVCKARERLGFIGCGDCNWMCLAALSSPPQCAAVDKSTEGAWKAALQSAQHHNIKSQADKEKKINKTATMEQNQINAKPWLDSYVFR